MSMLGLDSDGNLIAEGGEHSSRALWPKPFVSLATIIRNASDQESIPVVENLHVAPLLFREDTFDPVTRVRRGRLYRNDRGTQPRKWRNVMGNPDPTAPADVYLCTYAPAHWAVVNGYPQSAGAQLALGAGSACSVWDVVMVERITGRADLITLRARSTLGLLPAASELAISDHSRERVQKTIAAAVDASHRLLPDATVDACRHAAVAAVGAWLHPELGDRALHKDLGDLLNMLEGRSVEKPAVVLNVGRILARLHSRTKPNEQAARGVRINEDADGEAAISMLGLLLRELRVRPAITAARVTG